MKAAIYPGKGQAVRIQAVPDPEPGPYDLILKIHRCGICGTDLSMTKGGVWDFAPGQFGHEFAGEVVALGSKVDGVRIGDMFTAIPSLGCGRCDGCIHGNNALCYVEGTAAVGFAEYARIPLKVAVPLPRTLSAADGALAEPLAISLYGMRHSGMKPGDRVLILGAGTVGLYATYWARRMGAGRIVVLARSTKGRDLALEMGADHFLIHGDDEIGEVVEALGGTPDLVCECVGAPGLLGKAVSHAQRLGTVLSMGFCTAPEPFLTASPAYKCVTIRFLVGWRMVDFLDVVNQMDNGHVDPKIVISNSVPLADLPSVMDRLRGPHSEHKIHVRMEADGVSRSAHVLLHNGPA